MNTQHSTLKSAGVWALTGVLALLCLYLVFSVFAAGQIYWAMGLLVMCCAGFYIYLANNMFAYRFMFPGLAAMIVFVALPLVYTAAIGFTNYSSAHLLSEERARTYLLDQTEPVDGTLHEFILQRNGSNLVLSLTAPGQTAPTLISDPLPADLSVKAPVVMKTATQAVTAEQGLNLKEKIALRSALMALVIQLPDGQKLNYVGLREFGQIKRLWTAGEQGAVVSTLTNTSYKPDAKTGFFTSTDGQTLQPGYTVTVGFANYARMIGDAEFRGPFVSIFLWTVAFSGLTVLFTVAVGMPLAVLLNWEALHYRAVYRTLLFLPYAVPAFISILVFKGLFNQNFGEINGILHSLFGIRPAWFADPWLAKVMILIVNTWLGYPYIMILCSGLIKSIPSDLYEASALAGASPLTNFFKITAPLIIKPLTPLLVTVFAFNFNNFVVIALLTDGRPDFLNTKLPAGTTDILVSYTYRIAFQDSGQNFGLAAAISTVIFFMVAALSLVNLRLTGVTQRSNQNT